MSGKPLAARGLAGLWLLWFVAGLLPAWGAFRFLYADGAAYLIEIIHRQFFFFPWNGRQAAQVLDQWPAVLALLAGARNIRCIAGSLGAGMMFMPVLIHGLALGLLLRRGWGVPAAVYLAMLWLLQLYAGLMPVAEVHVAAAVFLLFAVAVLTGNPAGKSYWILAGLLGLISLRLYEFWFFYAVLLGAVLQWKLITGWLGMRSGVRWTAVIAIVILAASLLINLHRLLGAGDNPNRVSFMQMLSGTTLPVYLALITAWFFGLCIHVWLECGRCPAGWSRWLPPAKVRFGALLVSLLALLALSAFQFDTMVRYSYPFRVLNLALPVIFVAWLALAGVRGSVREWPAGVRGLLAVLTAALLIHETRLTLSWNRYQDWVAQVPAGDPGVKFAAQPPDTRLAQTWMYPWTHSAHSFEVQALRNGRVDTVAFDPSAGWNPYGPGHEDVLRAVADRCGIAWK